MNLLNRRRVVEKQQKTEDVFIKMKTRNNTAGYNIFGNGTNLSTVETMLVDGVEVTPVRTYDFGDTAVHDVYIKFKNVTTIPPSAFNNGNYSRTFLDIPECVKQIGGEAIRGTGASEKSIVIIRSKTMPTFGPYNQYGWTLGQLYVPDSLYDSYIAQGAFGYKIGVSKVHKISELGG
jgi:hypothetical protein